MKDTAKNILIGILLIFFVMWLISFNPTPWKVIAEDDDPSPKIITEARVVEVYDGDTIVVEVTKQMRIRMLDCWTPEIRTRDEEEKARGLAAKEHLMSMLSEGQSIMIEVPMTNRLQDSFTFGRVLAYVYSDVDQNGSMDNISEKMVDSGHATKEKE